jgi:hypothetical protein
MTYWAAMAFGSYCVVVIEAVKSRSADQMIDAFAAVPAAQTRQAAVQL